MGNARCRVVQYAYCAAVFVVIVLSAGLICFRIGEPLWEGGHHGFHMSEYPHNALNYLRFGYKETKLGLVMNYGYQRPDQGFDYRVDHPMITPVLISLAYRIFGVNPWSARLFPAVFAVGTVIMTWALSRQILRERWVVFIALLMIGLSPMFIYYGRMPAPHNLSTFFAITFFFLYWRWFLTTRPYYLILSLVVFFVGAYTDWVIYFTVPAVLSHYLIFQKEHRSWWSVVSLAIMPFFCFLLYGLWLWSLSGSNAFQSLWSTFLSRTTSSHGLSFSISFRHVWDVVIDRILYWFTAPLLLLLAGWLAKFAFRIFKRKPLDAKLGFIFAMLGFGISHNMVFLNLVLVHDFAMCYHLAPILAIMSGSFFLETVRQCRQRALKLLWALVAFACAAGFVYQALHVYIERHKRPIEHLQAVYVGNRLKSLVSPEGKYIDAVDLFQHAGHMRAYVTADRSHTKISTLADFKALEENPLYEAIIVDNGDRSDVKLRGYLLSQYHREDIVGYSIFDLSREATDLRAHHLTVERPYPLSFDHRAEYLGYEISEGVWKRSEVDNWWRRYVNLNIGYLPKYAKSLEITNYWRIPAGHREDLGLETHLVDGHWGGFGSFSKSLSGLYPTSYWPVDEVIKEKINVIIPSEKSSQVQALSIGVSQGTDYLKPWAPSVPVGEKGLVRVGQVYTLDDTFDADVWKMLQPRVDESINANLAGEISLIRIAMSQTGVFPGDVLLSELTWMTQASIRHNYKVFVHMVDSKGQLVSQHDSAPVLGRAATTSWIVDEPIRDVHPIYVPDELSPGLYEIYVGMYRDVDMQRVNVIECSNPVRNDAIYISDLVVFSPRDL